MRDKARPDGEVSDFSPGEADAESTEKRVALPATRRQSAQAVRYVAKLGKGL
jgi:hypothetical protein